MSWSAEAARQQYEAVNRANGALLPGGYGFIHPASRADLEAKIISAVRATVSNWVDEQRQATGRTMTAQDGARP